LAAINPPPPQLVVDRQKQALEDAIAVVEAEFAPPPPPEEDDLDAFLADFGKPAPAPAPSPAATWAAPAAEMPRDEPAHAAMEDTPHEDDGWPSQEQDDPPAPEAAAVDMRAHDVHAD